MNEPNQVDFQKNLAKATEIMYWVGVVSVPVMAWLIPVPVMLLWKIIFLALFASGLILFLFHWALPRYGYHPWVIYISVLGTITVITIGSHLLAPSGIRLTILYIAVIAFIGVQAGKKYALQTTFLSVLAGGAAAIIRGEAATTEAVWTLAGQALVLLLAGYGVSYLTGLVYEGIVQSTRRNSYLLTLLQIGTIAAENRELHATLSQIAERITRNVPVTTCQIYLLSPKGDDLICYGAYPIRDLGSWKPDAERRLSIHTLPYVQQSLNTGQYVILREDEIQAAVLKHTDAENLFFKEAKTQCILPLITKGEKLGVIVVGEIRQWEREPFYRGKLNLLQTLATQIASAIHSAQSLQEARRQAQRLAVLNEVAKAIGSTIELDALLELIYEQLSKAIPSDTYFVGLYKPGEDVLDLRIMIDDGQRFQPEQIPIGKGLSSWVVQNRRPLLLRNIAEESANLPIKPIPIGQDRPSASWLGVPMLAGDNLLGILAIASYTPSAFDEEDVNLLSNLGMQAALALDNARQHAAVKEQAQRDSLTGAYNHGYLLKLLNEEVERGRKNRKPVSLIMLDVDFFKIYNDHYGHTTGDEVLRLLVKTIQVHIKKTDIVGRWGGEEFAIALPGAFPEQAMQVAQRVRSSLARVELRKNGKSISSPTVSQGIATFPLHAQDTDELVDSADMALYQAKQRGRDHVKVADESTSMLGL